MLGLFALVTAAVFSGAAIYVNVAEQPARLTLADAPLLAEWKPAYQHGFAMQGTIALVSAALGFAAWWTTDEPLWLAGAIVVLANWPYTLIVMMPVNRQIDATPVADASPATRALIERWGNLHVARSLMGVIATALFLTAAIIVA